MRAKLFFIILMLQLLFVSCSKGVDDLDLSVPLSDTISLSFNFMSVDQDVRKSKAALVVNPVQFSDVNIFIYNDLGDLTSHKFVNGSSDVGSLKIFSNKQYTIYAIANIGRQLPFRRLSDAETYVHNISNIEGLTDQNGGVLMSYKTDPMIITNDMSIDIKFERVV